MNDATVLRALLKFIQPDTMEGASVMFDEKNPEKWSARIEVAGSNRQDRWFKGLGRSFKEEVWTPNEDPERQLCLP